MQTWLCCDHRRTPPGNHSCEIPWTLVYVSKNTPIQQDKGYGPAWSLEQSVQHQERWVKETNKHLKNISNGNAYVSTLPKWWSVTCIETIPINFKWSRYKLCTWGGGTHLLRQTRMCRSNGSLFYQKSLNMGPVFLPPPQKKILYKKLFALTEGFSDQSRYLSRLL